MPVQRPSAGKGLRSLSKTVKKSPSTKKSSTINLHPNPLLQPLIKKGGRISRRQRKSVRRTRK